MRQLAAAALLALVVVPAARAGDSIAVRASVTPRSHLFGDPVTAELEVAVDADAAATVRVAPDFRPYAPAAPVRVSRRGDGESVELHYRYTLDCLERACLPGDARRRFVFAPTHVRAQIGGRERETTAHWPTLIVRSRLAPEDIAREQLRSSVYPVGAVSYRIAPGFLFWALVCSAAPLALGATAVLVALAFGLRLPRRDRFGRLAPVERALVLVRAAAARGDAPRRRRALERLGRELEQRGRVELGEEACRLAWAEAAPDSAELLALAGRIERALQEAS